GGHDSPSDGLCLMEAVAYVRGIPHTDHPACVSEYLGQFGRTLNDGLDDATRQRLVRLIPLLPGTAGDGLDGRPPWMAADYTARVLTARWWDRAGLADHAKALRSLPPIVDQDSYDAAYGPVASARNACWEFRKGRWDTIRAQVREAMQQQAAAAVDAAA